MVILRAPDPAEAVAVTVSEGILAAPAGCAPHLPVQHTRQSAKGCHQEVEVVRPTGASCEDKERCHYALVRQGMGRLHDARYMSNDSAHTTSNNSLPHDYQQLVLNQMTCIE